MDSRSKPAGVCELQQVNRPLGFIIFTTYTLSVRAIVSQQKSALRHRNVVGRRIEVEKQFGAPVEARPCLHGILESHLFDCFCRDKLSISKLARLCQ